MSYIDEIIIWKREEEKKRQHTTLDGGVYIDGKMIVFERRKVCDKFSIMLPSIWKRIRMSLQKLNTRRNFARRRFSPLLI